MEENNFGIRKRLLEYDDVMNNQREVIYTRRRHALMGERIGMHLANTIYDTIKSLVEEAYDQRDFEGLKMDILKYLAMEVPMDEEHFTIREPKTA